MVSDEFSNHVDNGRAKIGDRADPGQRGVTVDFKVKMGKPASNFMETVCLPCVFGKY